VLINSWYLDDIPPGTAMVAWIGARKLVSSIWLQFIWLAVGSTVQNAGLSKVK